VLCTGLLVAFEKCELTFLVSDRSRSRARHFDEQGLGLLAKVIAAKVPGRVTSCLIGTLLLIHSDLQVGADVHALTLSIGTM
jgi:hypothetical protein